ncbi:hypothetical protein [Streptomyces cyaneofuscatus]|uniref:hypothetical protein n=1 Tax=Streptomyces cyaneofuscatus TaxID=66883 RepID=UPI0036522AA4
MDEPVRLYGATTRTVVIADSGVPGVDAELARIGGDLDLRRSTVAGGALNSFGWVLTTAIVAGVTRALQKS